MVSVVLKIIKWLFAVAFFILGAYCLIRIEEMGSIKSLIITIFSWGALFLMYDTKKFNKALFFASMGCLLLSLGLTFYLPMDYPAFRYDLYTTWLLWAYITGVPLMLYMYHKHGD